MVAGHVEHCDVKVDAQHGILEKAEAEILRPLQKPSFPGAPKASLGVHVSWLLSKATSVRRWDVIKALVSQMKRITSNLPGCQRLQLVLCGGLDGFGTRLLTKSPPPSLKPALPGGTRNLTPASTPNQLQRHRWVQVLSSHVAVAVATFKVVERVKMVFPLRNMSKTVTPKPRATHPTLEINPNGPLNG